MKKNRIVTLAVTAVMGFTLMGCADGAKKPAVSDPQKQGSGIVRVEPQKQAQEKSPAKGKESSSDVTKEKSPEQSNKAGDLTKKIEVLVEGQKEMREAVLAKSEALGFRLYVLNNFSLESEEPGKDVLVSKFDGEFFARIEKLADNSNISEYQNQQKTGFAQLGKVTELAPDSLAHQKFRDAKFCLLTEVDNSGKAGRTDIIYLVKEFNGKLFAITLHMPSKEAAEGITPSLWAMLSTLEAR